MATIGTLAVSITARSGKFVKGLKKAQREIAGFTKKIPGANLLLSKWGALMSGAAVAATTVFVKNQMDAIDAISKLSDELEIGTETLVGWQHAADITGTKTENLTKGLQRMMRRVGEATLGIGQGVKGFDMLGLSAEKLAEQSPEDTLYNIADAINEQGTAAEKAAAAYAIFGRQGQELMNFFHQGSEGLKALVNESDELGMAFSRVDGAKVEAANDALNRMGKIFSGIWRQLAIEMAPAIELVAKKFTDWAKGSSGLAQQVVGVLESVLKVIGHIWDGIKILGGAWAITFSTMVRGVEALLRTVSFLAKGLDWVINALDSDANSNMAGQLESWADSVERLANASASKGLEWLTEGINFQSGQNMADAMHNVANEAERAGQAYKDGLDSKAKLNKEAAAAMKLAEQEAKAAEEAERRIKQIAESAEQMIRSRERVNALSEADRQFSSDILKIEDLRKQGLDDLADRLQKLVDIRKTEMKVAKKQAEFDEKIAKQKQALVDKLRKQQQQAQREADAAAASKERIKDMDRELELLRAGTDAMRNRIQLHHEWRDAMERAGSSVEEQQKATLVYQEKLNELKRQEAEDAKKAAEANKQSKDAVKSMADQMKKDLDVTKKFHSAPGSGGLFGFGQGRVGQFAQFYDPSTQPKAKKSAKLKNAEKAAKAAVEAVPDVSKNIDVIIDNLQSMGQVYDRLNTSVKSMAQTSEEEVRRMRTTTAESVTALAKGQNGIRAEVDSLKKQLDYALEIGLGGE